MLSRRHFLKNTILSSTGFFVVPLLSFGEKKDKDDLVDDLENGFLHPPATAKPLAYWMWMNGHITKEGITLDLEAMKAWGLAGAFIYNANVGIPKGPVAYGSANWKALVAYAVHEAQRLGLQLTLHNSPGFSSTGGVKVGSQMSMQQLVWTETAVISGGTVNVQLPQPFTKLGYYKDAFVVAYPSLPAERTTLREAVRNVTINEGKIEKTRLFNNDLKTVVELQPANNNEAFLQLEFAEPFEARAITITRPAEFSQAAFDAAYNNPLSIRLQRSNDGKQYKDVCTVTMPRLRYMDAPGAQSFAAVKATFYRLVTAQRVRIAGIELHGGERLQDWPAKVNFTDATTGTTEQNVTAENRINASSVVDITSNLQTDGRLIWEPPSGIPHWTILRIGHTCTGAQSVASPDGATGLEIDKFSKEAVDGYFRLYLNDLLHDLRPFIPRTFNALFIDSWEVGRQNWSVNFPADFKERTQYEMVSWLPALTGRIVQSVDETEKFLHDVRRTQAALVADNYYGRFKKRCEEHGLQLYAQPNGDGMFDGLEAGGNTHQSLAEFWARNVPGTLNLCKQAVSIAHGYGNNIAAAEAFTGMPQTSRWSEYPYALKAQGDYIYSLGINRFVFHVVVHQPYTTGFPGMSMGPYGSHFDRNTTWMNAAKPWVDYLSRTQYLLQQGLPVADVCYFKGEEATSGIPDVNYVNPPVPKTLAGDVIGPDVLLNRVTVRNGRIVLPDGMQYSLLLLAPLEKVSLAVLQRLKALVEAGLKLVVTKKPVDTTGREDSAKAASIINELWGNLDGALVKERRFGKGQLYWSKPFADVLNDCNIKPDFSFTSQNADAAIHYTHRKIGNADVYFVSNHRRRKEMIVGSFRVTNKAAELWNPQSGERIEGVLYSVVDGRTNVPVELEPAGSVFIIFRKAVKEKPFTAVLQNGGQIISAKPYPTASQKPYEAVTNNFTLALWIKPDVPSDHPKGVLIFPPEGAIAYGTGHTACGLSAGQNGVRVYERDAGPNHQARLLIGASQPIEGWTHLVLRYADGKPSLFINGTVIEEGKPSGKIVHPGLHTPPTDEAFSAYFEGDGTRPELIKEALTDKAVISLYEKGLPSPELPSPVTLFRSRGGKLVARIWQNGLYGFEREGDVRTIETKSCKIIPLQNRWTVKFPPHSGAPASVQLKELLSLHKHPHFDVKHFSGTAVYETTFLFNRENFSAARLASLHLGRVECIAEVTLNGKSLGLLWKEPFAVNVTKALQHGPNHLQVAVTNRWPNRMIGDAHLPPENEYDENGFIKAFPAWYIGNKPKPGARKTFAAWNTFRESDPLTEAGLLGPVQLIIGCEKVLD